MAIVLDTLIAQLADSFEGKKNAEAKFDKAKEKLFAKIAKYDAKVAAGKKAALKYGSITLDTNAKGEKVANTYTYNGVTVDSASDLPADTGNVVTPTSTGTTTSTATATATGTATATATATSTAAVTKAFTLTNSVDIVSGDSGNDIFIAGVDKGDVSLSAGDQLTGGAGTDTLRIYNSATKDNGAGFTTALISGIEAVELTAAETTAVTVEKLDVSGNSEVTSVAITRGTDAEITLKLAQKAGLVGAINTQAAATFVFKDATGGSDTANLSVIDADLTTTGVAKGLTIANVETLNIDASGTSSLGTLTVDAATKLVITGSGSVSATLAGSSTKVKTIDGSTSTGNLTINNGVAAAAVESIKTGTGNDTYTTTYAIFTGEDLIDLGTGTDSLRFDDAATFNDTATKGKLAKVTGVEQLGTVNALLTVDGDFVTQTSYYTDGNAGDFALTNIAQGADVNFGAGAALANTVAMKLGANTLNVNITGNATTIADVSAGTEVTGSATINLKSSGSAANVNDNKFALTAADNQAVVLTGSQNLTLTTAAKQGVTGFSIDGSAFTGKLNITGTGVSDVVKGGTGNDTLSGGAGAAVADTLTGNAGNDKFVIVSGATSTTFDTITDFVSGTDTIWFGAALAASTDYTEGSAAVADFTAALTAANAVLTNGAGGAKQVNVQQVGSDSYVFYNDGTAANADMVVKLTGVALTGIAVTDIAAS
ncbi:hypothetical protein MASR1M60_02020 [Rhodocyclaceae bacterium]